MYREGALEMLKKLPATRLVRANARVKWETVYSGDETAEDIDPAYYGIDCPEPNISAKSVRRVLVRVRTLDRTKADGLSIKTTRRSTLIEGPAHKVAEALEAL